MKIIIILCVAILELVTFPGTEGYEFFYPYSYIDPMMRSGFNSPSVPIPSSRLLLNPLTNLFSGGCPINVIGGHVIRNVCFTVMTTPTAHAAAQTACLANGGTLAEPAPNAALSKIFYAALKIKFPTQFATVEAASAKFWIGYQQDVATAALPVGPLLALDGTGRRALGDNPIFTPLVTPSNLRWAAAIMSPTGATWQALDPAMLFPYICQHTVI